MKKNKLLSISIDELEKEFNPPYEPVDDLTRIKLELCAVIRCYRTHTGIPNKELAKILDMDESNLSKIILGKRENIQKLSVDTLLKILMKLRDRNYEHAIRMLNRMVGRV